MHFHVCVADGVFEALSDAESNTESITFHPEVIDEPAMAQMPLPVPMPPAQVVQNSLMVVPPGTAAPNEPPPKPKPRPSAHYLWAALIARIYEVFTLLCPHCGGQMRIIAFITFSADIHTGAPHITPARGPPLWEDCGGQESQEMGEGVEPLPDWDTTNQSTPDYPDEQRTAW